MTPERIAELRKQSQAVSKEYRDAMRDCLDEVTRLTMALHNEARSAIEKLNPETTTVCVGGLVFRVIERNFGLIFQEDV